MMKRRLSILAVLAMTATMVAGGAGVAAADTANAVYDDHSGTIYVGSSAGTDTEIADAVAADDASFVQMAPDSSITMSFPDGYYAVPDGTTAPDLSVRIYDSLYPALADVSLSYDGTDWQDVGRFADTADIDLDLWGPVKYVKIDQPEFCDASPDYCIDQDHPQLGFDLNAVVGLNVMDVRDGGFVTGGGWITSPAGAGEGTHTYTVWDQDFATDTDGWLDTDDVWLGTTALHVDGTAQFFGDESSAPLSRFDGYRDTWPGTWTAEIDVYLDPSWTVGSGFDYTVAANGSDGGHQRDYIFHVGVHDDGRLLVNGSNNTDFVVNDYKLENDGDGTPYVVTSPGWYTLQHVFYDAGGSLAVDLNLVDDTGTVVFTTTRTNTSDTIPGEVGGNRYSWFTFIDVDGGITVDNHELWLTGSPEGKATFGFVSKYKKGADVPTGNTEFQFEAADLNFHSSDYDWLVVNQGGTNAQYKGEGSVNGVDGYRFMLWAGDNNPDSPDTFRIKIWDGDTGDVVYDNGIDTVLGGGQVVIHTKGKNK